MSQRYSARKGRVTRDKLECPTSNTKKNTQNMEAHFVANTQTCQQCSAQRGREPNGRIPWIILHTFTHIHMHGTHVEPIAFGVSFDHNLQSQSCWYLFNGTWPKRLGELDRRLRIEEEETTLEIQ